MNMTSVNFTAICIEGRAASNPYRQTCQVCKVGDESSPSDLSDGDTYQTRPAGSMGSAGGVQPMVIALGMVWV